MIIFRYLIREILITMSAVTLVLLLVVMGSQFIHFFTNAANGDYPIGLVGNMMLYQLPSFLQLILPMSFFIGFLMAFGQLYLNSEMTVLQACGYSPLKLFKISLWPGVLTAVIVGLCSLWLTPAGMTANTKMLDQQASRLDFSVLTPGRFQELGHNRTVYVESMSHNNQVLNNVFMLQDEDGQLTVTRADSGYQFNDSHNGGRYLQLAHGHRYEVTPGSAAAQRADFDTYSSLLKANTETPDLSDPSLQSIAQLIDKGDNASLGELEFRISVVVMIPILALLAISLSKINPRQGRFAKLLPALLLHIIYILSLMSTNSVIQSGKLSPWIGMWPIHLAFLLLGIWFFRLTFARQGGAK